ncbi:PrsW family intramembrane metalloprotease [Haloglycomyces albus]|uniref:PrsW family intramembrane metalloprotease n=1 Tax=Haloglycomyces albus TaxID=526067 RepID=UPI0005508A47|nr:PrsW family intramembrane metalloprotease [Haloglycomyces albus]
MTDDPTAARPQGANQAVLPPVTVPRPPGGIAHRPPVDPRGYYTRNRRVVYWLISLVAFLSGGSAIAWVILASNDTIAVGAGVLAAFLPAPLLVGSFLWIGRHRHYGWKPLAFAFAWGATVATGISVGVNTYVAKLLHDADVSTNWAAVISAPVIEELTKFLAPLAILIFAANHLRTGLDALVFAGLSAAGFAVVENVLYASGAYQSGVELYGDGVANVTVLVVVRGILTMFAHPLFTCVIAFGFVLAIGKSTGVKLLWAFSCLPVAMGLHALWNWSAVFGAEHGQPALFMILYVALLMPLFTGLLGYALRARASIARQTYHDLQPFVSSGHIAPPEAAAVAGYGNRSRSRAWARRLGGPDGERAMARFHRLADDISEGVRFGTTSEALSVQLREMDQLRQWFFLRDPTMPRTVWDGTAYHITFPNQQVHRVARTSPDLMPIPVHASQIQPGAVRRPYGV